MDAVAAQYAARAGHPDSARQLGWLSAASQRAHHDALATMLDQHLPIAGLTVRDLGCGHGHAVPWIEARGAHYLGADVSSDAVALARQAWPGRTFVVGQPTAAADVTILVGTLAWHTPVGVRRLLDLAWRTSRVGIGFSAWDSQEPVVNAWVANRRAWVGARPEVETRYFVVRR